MKHTPGAWRIGFVSTTDDGECFLISGPRGTALDIAIIPKGNDEARANTHLIAAAPELLEALTMVRDADEDCRRDGLPTIPAPARAVIDAAIAKAEGNG